MNEVEKIQEERFVESLMYLWIAQDAPEWIKDYVRTELRKQRGLSDNSAKARYSESDTEELVSKMDEYLETHEIYKFMELVVSAIATKEQD